MPQPHPSVATRRTASGGRAFTLIELLVVISIIALLIGILLPVLGTARSAARSSVCLGHLRNVGIGKAAYAAENKGYIPGPNTSGYHLNDNTFDPADDFGRAAPVQNYDWISPILSFALKPPADRLDRMAFFFNEEFRCPENERKYDGDFGGGIPGFVSTDLFTNSYSMINTFAVYDDGNAPPDPTGPGFIEYKASRRVVDLDDSWGFQIDALPQTSTKIFAMDGARFVDAAGLITFNTFASGVDGHNYGSYGPNNANFAGSPYFNDGTGLTEIAEEFGFRHGGATNADFFDGHAETLDYNSAIQTELYYPSGSIVVDAANTSDPGDANGDVIE
ncbi:MAG: prepilin-type N-terminal cleavage/methylation domain-containing protein [Planctomycetota bacterium]